MYKSQYLLSVGIAQIPPIGTPYPEVDDPGKDEFDQVNARQEFFFISSLSLRALRLATRLFFAFS